MEGEEAESYRSPTMEDASRQEPDREVGEETMQIGYVIFCFLFLSWIFLDSLRNMIIEVQGKQG